MDTVEAPPAPCPVCLGFGVLERSDGKGLVRCACRETSDANARRRGAEIPERYRSCTITNFNAITDSQRGGSWRCTRPWTRGS
jgi:hypothetical protein